ncbi:MAG: hypothetical protein CBARDMAM_2677 [uncultured Caballeronia sp.]|nr:MAG: hypothetical protein CBARDMAM_2677 [uncultured Caballeronia sp.]
MFVRHLERAVRRCHDSRAIGCDIEPEGLRMALLKSKSEWARCLNAQKVYIGHRMYFPTEAVARLFDAGIATEGGRRDEANVDRDIR